MLTLNHHENFLLNDMNIISRFDFNYFHCTNLCRRNMFRLNEVDRLFLVSSRSYELCTLLHTFLNQFVAWVHIHLVDLLWKENPECLFADYSSFNATEKSLSSIQCNNHQWQIDDEIMIRNLSFVDKMIRQTCRRHSATSVEPSYLLSSFCLLKIRENQPRSFHLDTSICFDRCSIDVISRKCYTTCWWSFRHPSLSLSRALGQRSVDEHNAFAR